MRNPRPLWTLTALFDGVCRIRDFTVWVGRPLKWDPEREVFPGDAEANQYLDIPRRKGYELPEEV